MQPLLDAFSLGGTYALAALGLGLVFWCFKTCELCSCRTNNDLRLYYGNNK